MVHITKNRNRAHLSLIISICLLFGPLVLTVLGIGDIHRENRALAAFPRNIEIADYPKQLHAYLGDRVRSKSQAVRIDGWIDRNIFSEDPAFGGSATPRVVAGDDGYLFLADALDNACQPHAPAVETARNAEQLVKTISASGKDVFLQIAPDKSSVYPDLMRVAPKRRECLLSYRDTLWTALKEIDSQLVGRTLNLLLDSATKTSFPLYLRTDSHWNNYGSLIAVKEAIDRFAPGLWDDDEITSGGASSYIGDLVGLLGSGQSDQTFQFGINRTGVDFQSETVIDDAPGAFNKRYTNSGPKGRLIEGRTLLLLDSFGLAALPQIVPFFKDLSTIRLVDFEASRFVNEIAQADRIWIMSVERSASYRFSFEIASPDFLRLLRERL